MDPQSELLTSALRSLDAKSCNCSKSVTSSLSFVDWILARIEEMRDCSLEPSEGRWIAVIFLRCDFGNGKNGAGATTVFLQLQGGKLTSTWNN